MAWANTTQKDVSPHERWKQLVWSSVSQFFLLACLRACWLACRHLAACLPSVCVGRIQSPSGIFTESLNPELFSRSGPSEHGIFASSPEKSLGDTQGATQSEMFHMCWDKLPMFPHLYVVLLPHRICCVVPLGGPFHGCT